MMMFAALAALTGMTAGCFTSATAYTKKTAPDGTVTESKVSVVGTGDKVSSVAAEGLFADGTDADLGAGVKKANASQQSTGIDGTLNGLGALMTGMAKFMAAAQGVSISTSTAADADVAADSIEGVEYIPATKTYSTAGYDGAPGADGEGVYGCPSCPRCRAWVAARPDEKMIDISQPANMQAMWAALRARGYTGKTAPLPVAITADAYQLNVK